MRVPGLVATATAAVIAGGCGRDINATGPSSRDVSSVPSLSALRVETSGPFDAIVDFSTLRLTPRGSNCLLDVDGRLVFHGRIEGVGIGHTTALVFATCADVIASPPGTDPDVFHSEIAFEGTVGGVPASAHVLYQGRSQPGGHIDGRLIFSNGVAGELAADAQIAVGGVYSGSLVVP